MNPASVAALDRNAILAVVLLACTASMPGQGYPIWTIDGLTPSRSLGASTGGGGDVDLDGVPDVLIGGRNQALVISGQTGLIIHAVASTSGNSNGFGASVSNVGDVDGDLHADFLVGQVGFVLGGSGQAFLFSGATGTSVSTFSMGSSNFGASTAGLGDVDLDGIPDFAIGGSSIPGVVVFSGATGAPLHTVASLPFTSIFAIEERPVATAGDCDGDGHADFLVGLPPNLGFFTPPGSAKVYSGATGQALLTITGASPEFGRAVAGIGDVTGDGVPDYVIGAPRAFTTFVPAAPGYAQVISGATGAVVRTMVGDTTFDAFGRSVAGVGDIDGDGVPDLIVGAPGPAVGYAKIYSGATGEVLLHLTGGGGTDAFGGSVAGTGDLNGDGIPDFIIGAYYADPAGVTDAGRASILSYAGIPTGSSSFGSGCPSQSGHTPLILTGGGVPASTGNPRFRILLTRARPFAACALELGFSSTTWGTTPLPFNLAQYGMPACTQLVSPDFFFDASTTAGAPGEGRAVFPIPIPADATLAGATAYLQWYVVDPGPNVLPGVLSGALQATVQ